MSCPSRQTRGKRRKPSKNYFDPGPFLPPDNELKLRFEALAAMSPKEKEIATAVLDAMIVRHQVAGALERVSSSPPKGRPRSRERVRA
jgi:hypothetical protein